jgi:kynurenine formamidase
LPPRGATLIAAPLKLRGAPTSPARVFAALP